MRHLFILMLLMAALPFTFGQTRDPQTIQSLQGNWVGGFMFNGNWVTLNMPFVSTQGGMSGTANIAFTGYEGQNGVALTGIRLKDSRSHFELHTQFGNIAFDGTLADRTISGTYLYAGKSGTFGLTRMADVSPSDRVKLYGAYQANDRVISICDWDGVRMRFADYKSGQQNSLYPISGDTFFSGPGQAMSYPVTLKVRFVKDDKGEVTKLLWSNGGTREIVATKIKFKEEQLSFRNGDVTLGGTLITPLTKGPHPVIIITPGDFGTGRDALRMFANNFLRRGVAAFISDSRGAGSSTGPVNSTSFSDLADDVLAGVEVLKTRENINPKQIGVFGFSNSSWTVTLAASRSKSVAFLISQSTSALPPWQQESFRAERQVRLAGFPEDAVKNAAAFVKLKFEVARTGEGWEQLQATMENYRNERWFPYTNPPGSLERTRAFWARSASYDPAPAFERVTCPALIYFGALDSNMPVQASIPIIEQALKRAGNKDYTIKVFPNGRHDLMEGENGGPKESSRMRRYVPGYWSTMTNWLLKRINTKTRS